MAAEPGEGRYVYSVVDTGATVALGAIGLGDSEVYTIPHNGIAAVVHRCTAQPYSTEDVPRAREWVMTHNYVIDIATRRFGTVLPFSFNAIAKGGDEVVTRWLGENHGLFKKELERVRGKSEYTIQVFYDHEKLTRTLAGGPAAGAQKTAGTSKGSAYLMQRRNELKLKDAITGHVEKLSAEIYDRVRALTDDIKKEDRPGFVPEKYQGLRQALSLTCLAPEGHVEGIGAILEEYDNMEGLAIRFTGPWAPFSFISLKEV
jgi:hypothetical protein